MFGTVCLWLGAGFWLARGGSVAGLVRLHVLVVGQGIEQAETVLAFVRVELVEDGRVGGARLRARVPAQDC